MTVWLFVLFCLFSICMSDNDQSLFLNVTSNDLFVYLLDVTWKNTETFIVRKDRFLGVDSIFLDAVFWMMKYHVVVMTEMRVDYGYQNRYFDASKKLRIFERLFMRVGKLKFRNGVFSISDISLLTESVQKIRA